MSSTHLIGQDAIAAHVALKEDVSDPVSAMRGAGQDVSTFFEYGNWTGVDFRKSNLDGVSFKGAYLEGAIFTAEQEEQILKTQPKTIPDLPQNPKTEVENEVETEHSENFASFESQPHSIEAEQQLLGAILINNDVYDRVAGIVRAEHFFDPVHARIFEVAAARIAKNQLASPVTLKAFMEKDEGLAELGGPSYLARLAGAGASSFAARDYATMLQDLSKRRELITLADDIKKRAENARAEGEIADQILQAEQALYLLSEQGRSERGYNSFLKSVTDAVNIANAAYQRDSGLAGLSTGLPELDRFIGGFHQSDLYLLASRPSLGKTSLATDFASFCSLNYRRGIRYDGSEGAISGGVVAVCTPSNSSEKIASRTLAIRSGVPMHRIATGNMNEDEFRSFVEAAKAMEATPLYIDDTPLISISEVTARARRIKRTHGLDLLIVDSIQQIRPTEDAARLDSEDRSQVAQSLKSLARELDIPVIVVSELSSNVDERESRRPRLSDLREFGLLERYADVVMFLVRDEYYSQIEGLAEAGESVDNAQLGKSQIILAKNRHGPIGSLEVNFDHDFASFWPSFSEVNHAIAGEDPNKHSGKRAEADTDVLSQVAAYASALGVSLAEAEERIAAQIRALELGASS